MFAYDRVLSYVSWAIDVSRGFFPGVSMFFMCGRSRSFRVFSQAGSIVFARARSCLIDAFPHVSVVIFTGGRSRSTDTISHSVYILACVVDLHDVVV